MGRCVLAQDANAADGGRRVFRQILTLPVSAMTGDARTTAPIAASITFMLVLIVDLSCFSAIPFRPTLRDRFRCGGRNAGCAARRNGWHPDDVTSPAPRFGHSCICTRARSLSPPPFRRKIGASFSLTSNSSVPSAIDDIRLARDEDCVSARHRCVASLPAEASACRRFLWANREAAFCEICHLLDVPAARDHRRLVGALHRPV
jgi:hypothetical protein